MLKGVASATALMVASMVILAHAADSPTPSETVSTLLTQALPNVAGTSLTSVIVDYPPDGRSVPHRHPSSAFIYAYVLSGSIESQVEGDRKKRYKAGDFFVELPGAHHVVSGNASPSESARMLVVFVADSGAPLTVRDP